MVQGGKIVYMHLQCSLIAYSGKFLMVQNFAEMPPDPSEEIFAVFILTEAGQSTKIAKNLYPLKFSAIWYPDFQTAFVACTMKPLNITVKIIL